MNYSKWSGIKGKKARGIHEISENTKNEVITKAVRTWQSMGLTDDKIAFGIATMGVESGFDHAAKNPDTTAYGLGQFTDPTWPVAVNYYNKHYSVKTGRIILGLFSRIDIEAQILVSGSWIENVWARSIAFSKEKNLASFQQKEIAYALWHQGDASGNKRIGDFLNSPIKYDNARVKGYFLETFAYSREVVSRVDLGLDGVPLMLLHDSDPLGIRLKQLTQGLTIMNSGETLRRDGNKVWRITPNGKRSGYFISE